MKTLVLKRFDCVVDTDEVGDDSPYFLVVIGNLTNGNPSTIVKLVRKNSWDMTVAKGDAITANVEIGPFHPETSGTSPDKSLILVAMFEEDWDPDLTTKDVEVIKVVVSNAFEPWARESGTISPYLKEAVRNTLQNIIVERLENDTQMETRTYQGHYWEHQLVEEIRPKISSGGLLPRYTFWGDGGQYNIRFSAK
jgi:hypothetical protein